MNLKKSFIKLFILTLSACGGSDDAYHPAKINGNVSGLSGTLILQANNGEKFTITQNGIFDFKTLLPYGSEYKLRIIEEPCDQRCDVKKLEGIIEKEGIIDLEVSCRSKSWELPTSVSDFVSFPAQEVDDLTLSMNQYGDILSAWTQSDASGKLRTYKREFENRKWIEPENENDFINPSETSAYQLDSAINSSGNAYIIWNQDDFEKNQLYMAQKFNDIWVYPQFKASVSIPDSDVRNESPIIIKLSNEEDGIAVWAQGNGSENNLYFADLYKGAWFFPMLLSENLNTTSIPLSGTSYDVAMNEKGDVIVVWAQQDSTYTQIYLAERVGGKWIQPLAKKMSLSTSDAAGPKIAMDNHGNATVVWYQFVDDMYKIFKSDRRANGGWPSAGSGFTATGKSASFPDIAMNDSGHSILVWRESFDSGVYSAYKREAINGVWEQDSSATRISPSGSTVYRPTVEMDNQNNALIVWTQKFTDTNDIYYLFKSESHNVSGKKWQNPKNQDDHISPGSTGVTSEIDLAMDRCRMAIIWKQVDSDKNYQLFSAEYR